MRYPEIRQGSVFTPIIIFCLCIFVVGVLVAPTLALDFGFRSGAFKYAILGLPDQCPSLALTVERANRKEQLLLLEQVLGAALLKQRDPSAVMLNRVSVLAFGAKPATPAAIHDCISDLISRFSNSSGPLLDFLEQKYTTLSSARETPMTFYPAVVNACKKSRSCAKDIEVRYRNTKNAQSQEGLRLFLSDVGVAGAAALLTIVAETPGLGFGKFDSPPALHEEITRLLDAAVKDESRRIAWLLFVQDKSQKPILRWRVARLMRSAQLLSQDGWLIMTELLQTPGLPVNERWNWYVEEVQNWSATPQILSYIASEINTSVATAWTASAEFEEKANLVFAVIDSMKLAPPAEVNDQTTKAQDDFSQSIDKWLQKTVATFGVRHPLALRMLTAFENHKALKLPLPGFITLLSNPASSEFGLKLLLTEEAPSAETQAAFKRYFSDPKASAKEAILVKVAAGSESSGLRLLTLANGLDGPRRSLLLKKIQLAQVAAIARLEKEVASTDLPVTEHVHKLSILVNLKPQILHVKKLNAIVGEKFACEPAWIKPVSGIVMSGASHPVFLTALLKIISCPGEKVDVKSFAAAVNTVEARKKIQPYLNANSKLTPLQLNRLTEVFGLANRIPGSALPPKIKRPQN